MADLARIGVAIDSDLLGKFDKLIAKRGYANRSEAFRDLIRNELVQQVWQSSDSEVFGTVTLVYDHHVRLLTEKTHGTAAPISFRDSLQLACSPGSRQLFGGDFGPRESLASSKTSRLTHRNEGREARPVYRDDFRSRV